ncbi:magnesium transporter [Candidatus Micrarchaeota archaeon]|nr:magnesium transporter [Candidatus Micrarchaeota archaeon]
MIEQTHKKACAVDLMTVRVPVVKPNATIGDAVALFRKKMKDYDTVNYVYVVDAKQLVGVFSIKAFFAANKAKKVSEVMKTKLAFAHPHTHEEKVALLAISHGIKEVPVVDKEMNFLGVVPQENIFKVLHKARIETALRSAGIHKFNDPAKDIITAGALVHIQKRLPWLVLGVVGGIFAAFVVGFFEKALKAQLVLAVFIPTVVYIADAVGTQTETIFIRSIALDQHLALRKYLAREAKVALFLGLVLGGLNALGAFLWLKSVAVSVILFASIFSASLAAVGMAILLPLVFMRTHRDPAMGSGPFATIITDILSLVIYFAVASLLLGKIS